MRNLIVACLLISSPASSEPTALYMVQGDDVRGTSGYDLAQYDLLVCNADLDVAKLRAVAPEAILLAYVPMRFTAPWGVYSKVHNNWRNIFSEDDYWHDSLGNRISVTWQGTDELFYGSATADKLAYFIYLNIANQGWDGVYLDDFNADLPPHMFGGNPSPGGDRLPISAYSGNKFWDIYKAKVISNIRSLWDGLIICNVGERGDTEGIIVDGICSEEWWVTLRPSFVLSAQSYKYSVSWEWDSGVDGVYYGDIKSR